MESGSCLKSKSFYASNSKVRGRTMDLRRKNSIINFNLNTNNLYTLYLLFFYLSTPVNPARVVYGCIGMQWIVHFRLHKYRTSPSGGKMFVPLICLQRVVFYPRPSHFKKKKIIPLFFRSFSRKPQVTLGLETDYK